MLNDGLSVFISHLDSLECFRLPVTNLLWTWLPNILIDIRGEVLAAKYRDAISSPLIYSTHVTLL